MHRNPELLVLALMTLACMVLAAPMFAQDSSAILLQNVRAIAGEGTVIEGASILIEDGLITGIGNSSEFNIPENVLRLDLTGKTVIPALIDATLTWVIRVDRVGVLSIIHAKI